MKRIIFFALFFVLAGTTFAATSVVVEDSEIQKMVDICKKNNYLTDPDHIEKGQSLMWEFPDNHRFQFYQDVEQDESLWIIAKNLLIITHDYHIQAKKSSTTFAQAAPDSSSVKGKDTEAESKVLAGEQEAKQKACLSRMLFVLSIAFIILMFFALKRWKKII